MPKPKSNPARKKSTWSSANYDSGNRRMTDVEQSHANNAQNRRNEIQQRKTAEKAGRIKDHQMRQTDTGTKSRNERIKAQRRKEQLKDFNPNKYAQKIDQYTDNNTSRKGGRTHYGNAEATKRAMKEKYGDRSDWQLSRYERMDIKGKALEDKIKRKWKPSDVSYRRPDDKGLEWSKHKYIDKVRTKSGKIRYIYNVEGGGSSHEDARKTMRKNQNSKAASQINYNKAQARKAVRSAGNKAKAFLSKLFG